MVTLLAREVNVLAREVNGLVRVIKSCFARAATFLPIAPPVYELHSPMTIPGAPSLFFLFYLLLFLPWVSFRSARRLRAAREGAAARPPRTAIWTGTLVSQTVLLTLAWLVGRGFGYEIFAVHPLQPRHLGAALLALAVCFAIRSVGRAIRSPEERRRMEVYAWAPRQPNEWMLWTAAVLIASVAEEAAYRGVGMSILWYATGNPWLAALICAAAFALAHSTQGWKSAALIFAIALVMHALVAFTGTLVLAMAVHAVYDLAAGYAISRTARLYEEQTA